MPKGIPLTTEEQAARRRAIFDATVGLILGKGFHETSMREIAEAAGMGKSSLYDYFQTKDAILLFILEEEGAALKQRAEEIAALPLAADERLRRIMHAHLEFMQANGNLLLRLNGELQRLGPDSQRRMQETRYAYQDMVARVIEQGIAQGCFRPVPALHTARLLINSLVTVLYTTRPTGSAQEMMDETIGIFFRGILQ